MRCALCDCQPDRDRELHLAACMASESDRLCRVVDVRKLPRGALCDPQGNVGWTRGQRQHDRAPCLASRTVTGTRTSARRLRTTSQR